MRFVSIAAAAMLACGCADMQSDLEPHVPVNAQFVEHERMKAPDIRDGFDQTFYSMREAVAPPRMRHSISLGYIGDSKIGTEWTPPHGEPYWSRPFPCHWTGTCSHGYGMRSYPW